MLSKVATLTASFLTAVCADPQIEEIPASYLNTAMDRMLKSDVHYRFVIDVQGSMVQ